MHPLALLVLGLILLRWAGQFALERLNQRHVRAHAQHVPAAFQAMIDPPTYQRAAEYTLAKSRLSVWESVWGVPVLLAVLWALPTFWKAWTGFAGTGIWAAATGLFLVGIALTIPSIPFDWWGQFRLEERFGFNTSTQRTWWLDRLKSLLLGAVLGIPLLALVFRVVEWAGPNWWIWGAAAFVGFQLLMMVAAPVIILPLFNKFQPLATGPLRDRLMELARRTGFRARSIEVMDGSRRSRHANAFFTGLGRFRKIVLFDTLLAQLGEDEIEAVLAHEIGHYRLHHIPKLVLWSACMTLVAFGVVAWLAQQPAFFEAFGFESPSIPVALLLFVLLSDTVTFWIGPLRHGLSRRFEFQADAFASRALGAPQALISALRKLHTKNLSNLTPHPLYSRFHYSHPTLVEREEALAIS